MTSSKPSDPAPCPTCRGDVVAESEHLPFCSRRCQMIDLGRWFNGEYAVPGEDAIDLTSIEFPPGFDQDGDPGRA